MVQDKRKNNMFNAKNLKVINYDNTKSIEGGGDGSDMKPRINVDDNNIETMNKDDLYFYINNWLNGVYEEDLMGRKDRPFYSKNRNRTDELMGILAVESLSSRDKDGNILEADKQPYNIHATLQDDYNDSYGVFQIDTGPALPYILMAMDPQYKKDLNILAKTGNEGDMNEYAKRIFEDEDVKTKVYSFLKDPSKINEHLAIAATIWNDFERSEALGNDGAKGWNAYNNKNKSKEFADTYNYYMNISKEMGLNYLQKEIENKSQRHREEFDDLKQFLNMPRLGATIEEAANNLAAIYEEAVREGQIPKEAAPVDNLKELGKMFRR